MILSKDFVTRYDHKIINIHPSLIPSFCGDGFYGLRPHIEALKRGVKVTGATVHYVNEVPDGGQIIMQKPVMIKKNDTPKILQKRVMFVFIRGAAYRNSDAFGRPARSSFLSRRSLLVF